MWGWRGIQPTDNLMGCSSLTMAMASTRPVSSGASGFAPSVSSNGSGVVIR